MKKYKLSLFIFRRDLRLNDNIGLIKAMQESELVIPCFIFDPRQIGSENEYKSDNCVQFLIESLIDLEKELQKYNAKLYIFYGKAEDVIKKLTKLNINSIFCNEDYTPFSIMRDNAISKICILNSIEFNSCFDILLINPKLIKKQDGTPYTIFTPFFKHCVKTYKIDNVNKFNNQNFYTKKIKISQSNDIFDQILNIKNEEIYVQGGRSNGLKLLKQIKKFINYNVEHNFPAIKTTGMSAHLKFGTISIREAYHSIKSTLGINSPLIRQLYWRDFFTYIAYHSPFVFGHSFKLKYDKLWWQNDNQKFNLWCNGLTGFPIVDAGMRQLNKTGFMHNRVRLIVASFLVKDLHIDWKLGEKYFAQKLVDYDPAVNNGNWQWCASTGADAQPYFRIFNPWLQQKKFDPKCEYIKKWVPELKHLDIKVIHNLHKSNYEKNIYPSPIINHEKEIIITKKVYKQ